MLFTNLVLIFKSTEWFTISACPSLMCFFFVFCFNRGNTEGANSSKLLCLMFVCVCFVSCKFVDLVDFVVWWLVCRKTRRQTEICFQPWHDLLWLTGLKVPTNWLTLPGNFALCSIGPLKTKLWRILVTNLAVVCNCIYKSCHFVKHRTWSSTTPARSVPQLHRLQEGVWQSLAYRPLSGHKKLQHRRKTSSSHSGTTWELQQSSPLEQSARVS